MPDTITAIEGSSLTASSASDSSKDHARDVGQSEKSSGAPSPPAQPDLSSLDHVLFPADSYTADTHTYWADLPFMEKTRWVNAQSNAEARRELGVIGRMFKEDPLSPVRSYFSNYVVTGMGLLVEGYVLFSVGNLKSLFKLVWPSCWKSYTTCDENWVNAVDYLEIVGIIVGQVLVGIEGDWIGRRFGMVQDALVMTLGSIMLTAAWGNSLNGWVICYAWSLFIYGIGVGGEYPMTSGQALATQAQSTTGDRMHRGRKVALAFTMQGWGQLLNQGILLVLLLIFHGSLNPTFSETSTQWTFRIQFAVIILPTLYLAYLRYYKIKYYDSVRKSERNVSGYSLGSLRLASGHYWHRMVGTAIVWFINDVLFYGSKIFSGVFIARITGGSSSLKTTWLYNLLNVGISLVGYYLGALLIDHKQYGRKWMQTNGLLFIGVVFAICAAQWDVFVTPGAGTHAFMALYFLSSFFTQFGPNVTSFLLAAEVYPGVVRNTAHGISAATGKCGALLAAVLYNYIGDRTKFFVVFPFGFAGALLTLIFVPDTTGLDLREQERYYQFVLEGREGDYHGVAVHPRHLSLYERVVLRRHLAYNPELDHKDKIDELRNMYHSSREKDFKEEGLNPADAEAERAHRDFLENELGGYFGAESKLYNRTAARAASQQPSKLANIESRL